MAEPQRKPISQGLIARVTRSLGASASAFRSAWFGPLDPPTAQVPSVEGRQFDFPAGLNLQMTPREGEVISFGTMRALADGYDLMRLVIESRKDQLVRFDWSVRPKDREKDPDDRCKEVEALFRSPDHDNDWQEWLRAIVEEMLVTDAACIYPRRTRGGGIWGFELMDGTTIKRVIDEGGRTPQPPLPAYQQILKGVPVVNYTRDELIYRPRNRRVYKLYGYSPVEQVIVTVNIALQRQASQLTYYTHGSTPNLLLAVPETWNPEQIKTFQLWWDSLLAGNTVGRAGTKFVPAGLNPINTKEQTLKDEYDEWLARIICYAFSVSPQALLAMMNRATAEVAHATSNEEGLHPLLTWVKGLIDSCILRFFGYADLQFQWDMEEKVGAREQAEIDEIYTRAKVKTPDEVRASLNLDPLSDTDREKYWPPKPDPMEGGAFGKPGEKKPDAKKPGVKKLDDLVYGGLEKKKSLLP